jgi:hypothetical protein
MVVGSVGGLRRGKGETADGVSLILPGATITLVICRRLLSATLEPSFTLERWLQETRVEARTIRSTAYRLSRLVTHLALNANRYHGSIT